MSDAVVVGSGRMAPRAVPVGDVPEGGAMFWCPARQRCVEGDNGASLPQARRPSGLRRYEITRLRNGPAPETAMLSTFDTIRTPWRS